MSKLLKEPDFVWKELYPNNMPCNGIEGYYCLVNVGNNCARKYTIKFQKETLKKDGSNGILNNRNRVTTPVEFYILLEQNYSNIKGEIKIPEPSNDFLFKSLNNDNTFSNCSVNTYGSFIRVYKDLEGAKTGAYGQYIEIYGFVSAHLAENKEDAIECMQTYK